MSEYSVALVQHFPRKIIDELFNILNFLFGSNIIKQNVMKFNVCHYFKNIDGCF